jgi:hypothetical protein
MQHKSLHDLLQEAGNPVTLLRNSQTGPYVYPVAQGVFSAYILATGWGLHRFRSFTTMPKPGDGKTLPLACGHDEMLDQPEELTQELLAASSRSAPGGIRCNWRNSVQHREASMYRCAQAFSPNKRIAFSFRIKGRTSSRIDSFWKSASHRSGEING